MTGKVDLLAHIIFSQDFNGYPRDRLFLFPRFVLAILS